VDTVQTGDEITVDFEAGVVTTAGERYTFPPLAPAVMEILDAGGLVPHVRKKLGIA
jgi:3-isopropylmalate/(R)-2-methylmalate dehydratase small subunit